MLGSPLFIQAGRQAGRLCCGLVACYNQFLLACCLPAALLPPAPPLTCRLLPPRLQLVASDGVLDRNFTLLGPGDTEVGWWPPCWVYACSSALQPLLHTATVYAALRSGTVQHCAAQPWRLPL